VIVADVAVPDGLWDTQKIPEGIVANWFLRDGSAVKAGATIAELMVEKTTYEIAAPTAGRLHILIPKDGVVRPGTVIGRIEEG
jgi:pyruvate/2-oxoglutarate dehydrogenase complex dihydrolipoamide acyltransferase (E2) component